MAYDKVVDSSVLDDGLQQIADAIREKGGTSASLAFPNAMAEAIAAIPTGEEVEQATPEIDVSSSGLITATAGDKSATKQLTTQAARTITPTTSNLIAVSAGKYTIGHVTVKGDANLKAENIAEGVSIFGVLGTFEGGGLPDGVTAVATGTFTPASDTYEEFFPHGLGVKPTVVYYHAEGTPNASDFPDYTICGLISTISVLDNASTLPVMQCMMYGWLMPSGKVTADIQYSYYTDEEAAEEFVMNNTGFAPGHSDCPVKAGVTYHWVACAIE